MTEHPSAPAADDISSLLTYTPPAPEPAARPGVVAALVVGIVGLLAAGVFALVLATGDGGSSTPEDAVQALLDAAAAEDVIGALDALAPSERRALQRPVEDLAGELRRLGVLAEDFDLRSLDGIDLEFEDVEMGSEALDEDLAVVTLLSGTVRATTTPREAPVGPLVERFLAEMEEDPFDAEPETTVEQISSEDARIATVREDGRWYVSLFYSVAEAARLSAGQPVPDFDAPVPAVGASSPEAAVEETARAAIALDVRRLIELTPPDEMAVLHDYAPLFLDDAEAAVAELRAEEPFELRLDRLEMDSETDGDVAVVSVSAFGVSGHFAGEPVELSYDGECVRALAGGEEMEQCAGNLGESLGGIAFPAGLQGMDFRLRTVLVDGEWYVSPTRTVLGALVDVLREIDQDDIEQFVEAFQEMFAYGFGASTSQEFAEIGEAVEGDSFSEYGELDAPHELAPVDEDPFKECWTIIGGVGPNATPEEQEAAERELQACMERSMARGGEAGGQ